MSENKKQNKETKTTVIQGVPTNIITGFLGVGKTSTIQHLLKNKTDDERWAILVNEFGEIGVDGSLLEGQEKQKPDESGVFIREVPGGCMCCAAGVPMQIALNQLLNVAKPDRLLIEPTGLGHPKEILQVLSSEHYREVLSLQKIISLVDARNLSDKRYTCHETFNQQIAIADTIVGNKSDLYDADDKTKLIDYIQNSSKDPSQDIENSTSVKVIFAEHGCIDIEELQGLTSQQLQPDNSHHHHGSDKPLLTDLPIPECGFIKAVNEGEGFQSIGWRFSPDKVFDRSKLVEFIWSCQAQRAKAVFITSSGLVGFNLDKDVITESVLEYCEESRIEIISASNNKSSSQEDNVRLEQELLNCILP